MIPVPDEVLRAFLEAFHIKDDPQQIGDVRASGDGNLYEFGPENARQMLKVLAIPANRPDSLQLLEARINFACFLGAHEVPIAHPKLSPQGALVETYRTNSHIFAAYVMDKAQGKHLHPPQWNENLYYTLGRVIGRMHRVTQEYDLWLHPLGNSHEDGKQGWYEEWQGFYRWCKDEEVKEHWLSIKERLEQLPVTRDAFGFIHNDPHPYNILVNDDAITVLDFDVATCHWFTTDIAIALQGVLFQAGGFTQPVADATAFKRFLTHFRVGYAEENSLAEEWWNRLDLFISYRRILLFVVSYTHLAQNLPTLAAWKQMITTEPAIVSQLVG